MQTPHGKGLVRASISLLPLLLLLSALVSGQTTQQTAYFDAGGKLLKSKDKATYYNVASVGPDGKVVGALKGYYMGGKIKFECERVFGDWRSSDPSVVLADGKCVHYFESGGVEAVFQVVRGIKSGPATSYFETGEKECEGAAKNDEPFGKFVCYHKSGKVHRVIEDIEKGKVSPWFTECDESGTCERVFDVDIESIEQLRKMGWSGLDGARVASSKLIVTGGGQGRNVTIDVPIDVERDFSIEMGIEHLKGDEESFHGMVFGYRDGDNYNVFFINADDAYPYFGTNFKGIWKSTKTANGGYKEGQVLNRLRVSKIGEKIFFTVNGGLAYTVDAKDVPFRGNKVGLLLWAGNKEVAVTGLTVRVGGELPNVQGPPSGDWTASGTGFFIDSRGYLVTNHHVIDNAKALEVDVMQDGEVRSFKAAVVAKDKSSDLAVIRIEDDGFKQAGQIPYGVNFGSVDTGTGVFTLGFPKTQILGEEIKFTDGKISSKTGYQGDITSYQISVPAQPGSSGGPLFDSDGNLVGVVNAGVVGMENVTYAVKTIYLAALLDSLPIKLNLPKENSTSGMKDVDRIRKVREFVVKIKVKR